MSGRRGGCIFSEDEIQSQISIGARSRAPLPAYVDLSPKMLPVRDQGSSSKCTAYAICSLKELQDSTGAYLSPSFVYDRRNRPDVDGMTCVNAMQILNKIGVCSERKYNTNDEMVNAAAHKIRQPYNVRDLNTLKTALSTGEAALIALRFYPDAPEAKFWLPHGPMDGGHAVTIVGYDDARQELTYRNSWGKSWNGNGHGKISYSDYKLHVIEAYSCYDSDGVANPEPADKKSGCCVMM